jgi:alpha-1,2-mannosyltransferase
MTWWMRFNQLLNPRRLKYAWIAGGALWFAWLVSCILGPGNMDLAGHVVGTDYITIFASGIAIRQAESTNLYNFDYQAQLEQSIAGPELTTFNAFITPPFLAWLFVPFSVLPYVWSFTAWSLLSILFLWVSIKLLTTEQPMKAFLFSLTWFPIFATISFGENSLLSLFILCLTFWLWRKEKYLLAGLASSLVLYKPQLILGVGLLWLLEYRRSWKSLLGLALGGVTLVGLCFWLLPDASRAYIELARNTIPGMIYQDQFPLWHLHSLRGFWLLLFPGQKWLVEGLSLILSAVGIVAYILFWRVNRKESELLFAGAICLTVWITPHAMIYDWSILIIPAILLWEARPGLRDLWKPLYALIWIATFLSGILTYAQLNIFPIAIQLSVPILFLVYFEIYKHLTKPPSNGVIQSTLE